MGSVEPFRKLHARWGGQVHFLVVEVRQAHPGPDYPRHTSAAQKLEEAREHHREAGAAWITLVDDLQGTVHQVYGGLSDPSYLIDSEGRVAFYNLWSYAPVLHEAIARLLEQGGRGVVMGGVNRLPHLGPAVTDGWPAIQRGLPQSLVDLETAMPGGGALLWLGHQARPLLAPLTLRARPLPQGVTFGLAAGAALVGFALGRWLLGARGTEALAFPGRRTNGQVAPELANATPTHLPPRLPVAETVSG